MGAGAGGGPALEVRIRRASALGPAKASAMDGAGGAVTAEAGRSRLGRRRRPRCRRVYLLREDVAPAVVTGRRRIRPSDRPCQGCLWPLLAPPLMTIQDGNVMVEGGGEDVSRNSPRPRRVDRSRHRPSPPAAGTPPQPPPAPPAGSAVAPPVGRRAGSGAANRAFDGRLDLPLFCGHRRRARRLCPGTPARPARCRYSPGNEARSMP